MTDLNSLLLLTFSLRLLKIADGNSSYAKTTEHERIRLIHSAKRRTWKGIQRPASRSLSAAKAAKSDTW